MLLVASLPAFGARAAPGDKPLYLRVETGEHEATINRLAIAPDGAAAFTAADDKTARAWSADTLRPQGIMRPPVGAADDGALYAVAVSARLVAVAGRIRDANGGFAVHLFTRSSLRPAGNIAHFPQPIRALRFSADGALLAVGMQDGGGLRVLDMAAHTETLRDTGYGGAVTWMDFAPNRTLAVVADDGTLRLCGAGRAECASYLLPGGAKPWSVAVSPDGTRIAVGDRQAPLVHLFDVEKGRFIRDLKGAPQRQGALGVVAFSRDGQTVFAAGTYKESVNSGIASRLLRRWTLDGRAAAESAVATDTVTDLAATASGVIFTTAEPATGRLDQDGQLVALRRSRHIDFRNAGQTSFRVSRDGGFVEMPSGMAMPGALPGGPSGGSSVVFDVIGRRFVSVDAVAVPLASPFAGAAGIVVTEWRNNHGPRVNGQLVPLEPAEFAHAVAVARDGSAVALGTDFFVRCIGLGGERWKAVTSAPAWAVNVSGDGRLVVAGLGDGTVHWYRVSDGREVLMLFADPATGRWVLSTPEGYFDHDRRSDDKPDGRTMVGYQTAPGSGASAFVEVGQLYPRFFRPDLVGLSFRDDDAARETINDQHERLGSVPVILQRGLPPGVRVLSLCARAAGDAADRCVSPGADQQHPDQMDTALSTSADTVRIRFQLDQPADLAGGVIIRRNHAAISPPVVVEEETAHSRTETAEIPLGLGANDISLTPVSPDGAVEASDRDSARVRIARLPLLRGGPSQPGAAVAEKEAEPRSVTLHVLSVGISHFSHPTLNLNNAANDAKAFAELMQQPTPPVSNAVDALPPLIDEQATRANILSALAEIAAKAQPDDLVVIFLAGHGEAVDGRYYFAPYDLGTRDQKRFRTMLGMTDPAEHDEAMDRIYRAEGLGQDDMLPLILSIRASRVAIMLDTCYSGTLATVDAVVRREKNDTITTSLGHAGGRFVLSGAIAAALDAAGPSGEAPGNGEIDGEGHGLFSSVLLRALAGDADMAHSGRIDISSLAKYTQAHVDEASMQRNSPQHPMYYFAGGEFFDLRATAPAK